MKKVNIIIWKGMVVNMWKERIKGFVLGGLVVGILTNTVVAAPVEKTIKAIFNNIKIYVDGNYVDCKDAAGNKVEPFIYNGTTYLPIRSVGQAFGKNVKWDGKTNSVFIGKTDENTPAAWLEDINPMSFVCFGSYNGKVGRQLDKYGLFDYQIFYDLKKWNPDSDYSNTNEAFGHGVKLSLGVPYNGFIQSSYAVRQSKLEYFMNQKYKKIKGKLLLHSNSANTNKKAVVKIYKDDELAYTSPVIGTGSLPSDFDIDITGTIKLTIIIEAVGDSDDDALTSFYLGLVNVALYD